MKAKVGTAVIAGLMLLVLCGCTPTIPLQPAADATNPKCASVIVHLPATVAGLSSRQTNAQSTAAYGDPTRILLHCGVAVPDPTAALPCVTVEGIDWLRDDSGDPNFVFTTYGRNPAVQLVVNDKASSTGALTDVAVAVGTIPSTRKCIAPADPFGPVPTPTGVPTGKPKPSGTPTEKPTTGPVTR
ncbi:MAG: hypothetical protein JWR53_1892 [Glaciihabitans sp.]|jgi:hypothetical protein|nr:hypothetical protein [Glaciihabitans sp.]MCU1535411.1 hypothetical protein [Glaciihabitans sp.]MDQ1555102.1 hypothetical protein [Actinomycetota bacterium]